MEGLAAAGGVITVVSLAGQVVQGCKYLHTIFEDAKDAPTEVRLLNTELAIIDSISTKFATSAPDDAEHRAALDFCNEAIYKLRDLVDKYSILTGTGRRKWSTRLGLALNNTKIMKYLNRLREAKGHLERFQTLWVSLRIEHNETRSDIRQLGYSLQRINSSNSQITAMVAQTHDKVDGISCVAEEMKHLLQNMAGQFMLQKDRSLTNDGQTERCIANALESILENSLKKHFQEALEYQSSFQRHSSQPEAPYDTLPNNMKSLNASTKASIIDNERSQLEKILAEFSGEIQTMECPDFELTSKYSTQIGQVLMRTSSRTYLSRDDLETTLLNFVPFPNPNAQELSSDDELPITVRRMEILLLPGSWKWARGATIRLHQMAGSSTNNSNLTFQMENFSDSRSLPRQLKEKTVLKEIVDNESIFLRSNGTRLNSSPLLLYTAFKTAFVAQQMCSEQPRRRIRDVTNPISIIRQSPDTEVNDVLDLVNLWIESGLSLEFYQDIFPGELDNMEKSCKAVFQPGNIRLSGFEKLRHEYVYTLVIKMFEEYTTDQCQVRYSLHDVHANHWDRYQGMAFSALGVIVLNDDALFESMLLYLNDEIEGLRLPFPMIHIGNILPDLIYSILSRLVEFLNFLRDGWFGWRIIYRKPIGFQHNVEFMDKYLYHGLFDLSGTISTNFLKLFTSFNYFQRLASAHEIRIAPNEIVDILEIYIMLKIYNNYSDWLKKKKMFRTNNRRSQYKRRNKHTQKIIIP
ncbi:hypothetical protein NHQ30_007758 [Ciborinia camelliae]|nr:hypothetical protein NHQ30_007758 [Ciborinia camelliae]